MIFYTFVAKMKPYVFLLFCVALYQLGECSNLAPFITPCRETDSACLKSTAEKALPYIAAGVPSLGIATLDPMLVEQVTASQAGLDLEFRNTVVTGLKHSKVLNLKRQKNKIYLDLRCSVFLKGDYTLGGKLLIMPVQGNGKYGIRIRDIVVKILFQLNERSIDGVKYWKVESWKHSSEVETGASFHFKNLFNGNKELSDAVHEFANQNWRDIFQEVAPPVVKAIVAKIMGETNKIFDKVPIKDLVIE